MVEVVDWFRESQRPCAGTAASLSIKCKTGASANQSTPTWAGGWIPAGDTAVASRKGEHVDESCTICKFVKKTEGKKKKMERKICTRPTLLARSNQRGSPPIAGRGTRETVRIAAGLMGLGGATGLIRSVTAETEWV